MCIEACCSGDNQLWLGWEEDSKTKTKSGCGNKNYSYGQIARLLTFLSVLVRIEKIGKTDCTI